MRSRLQCCLYVPKQRCKQEHQGSPEHGESSRLKGQKSYRQEVTFGFGLEAQKQ